MTEQEWLASKHPATMLRHLTHEVGEDELPLQDSPRKIPLVSDRKLRLFAVACCRQVWHLLTDDAPCLTCGGSRRFFGRVGPSQVGGLRPCPDCKATGRVNRSRRAVEVAERYADGEAKAEEIEAARLGVSGEGGTGALLIGAPGSPERYASLMARCCLHDVGSMLPDVIHSGRVMNWAATQVALLRCIVGNPFRPVMVVGLDWTQFMHHDKHILFYERWRTPTVLSLAQAAYDERPGRKCEECAGTGAYFGPPTKMRDGRTMLYGGHCKKCPKKDEEHGTGRIDDGTLDPVRLMVLADALEEAGCEGERCSQCHGSGTYTVQATNPGLSAANGYGAATTYSEWRGCRRCGGDHDRKGTGRVPHPVLAHLRSPGPHVRGCWALDLLLGNHDDYHHRPHASRPAPLYPARPVRRSGPARLRRLPGGERDEERR